MPTSEPHNVSDQQAQRKPLDDGPHFFLMGTTNTAERRTAPLPQPIGTAKNHRTTDRTSSSMGKPKPPSTEPAQRLRSTSATKTAGQRTALLPQWASQNRRTPNRATSPINRRNENHWTTDRTSSPMGTTKTPNAEPHPAPDQQAQRKPQDNGPHFFPNGHDKYRRTPNLAPPPTSRRSKKLPDDGTHRSPDQPGTAKNRRMTDRAPVPGPNPFAGSIVSDHQAVSLDHARLAIHHESDNRLIAARQGRRQKRVPSHPARKRCGAPE